MKILHINNLYGQAGGGGTEQSVPNTCALLEELGHETVVLYGRDTGAQPSAKGRPVYHIPGICDYASWPNRQAMQEAMRVVEAEDPDVIHLHQIGNYRLAQTLVRMKPTVSFAHNHDLTCPAGTRLWHRTNTPCTIKPGVRCFWHNYADRCGTRRPLKVLSHYLRWRGSWRVARSADVIGVDSTYMKQTLLWAGFADAHIVVTPTVTELPPLPDQESYPGDDLVLYVGRLTEIKGAHFLIGALSSVSVPWRLIVVGDGHYLPTLKEMVRQQGLEERVTFAGWVLKKNLSSYYQRAAVVVVPSIYPEPYGLVGVEAMAHSRPVVAFDVGGIPDWLAHEETGLLVAHADARELGRAIEQLLQDKPRAQQMGWRGRKVVETRLNPQRHLEALLEMYRLAIEHRGGAVGAR